MYPMIQVTTTDADIADKVVALLDASRASIVTPRNRKHSTTYHIKISGVGILPLLDKLAPLMGERRRAAIEVVTKGYSKPISGK
jgi:hypothetical protein